jgi:hypothetical protein
MFPWRYILRNQNIAVESTAVSMDTSDQQTRGHSDWNEVRILFLSPFTDLSVLIYMRLHPLPHESHVEAGSNTCTIVLLVVGDDKKGTQCLRVLAGHPVPVGYKYRDLDLQVGGFSNLRQYFFLYYYLICEAIGTAVLRQ